jgi:hypothetical protein
MSTPTTNANVFTIEQAIAYTQTALAPVSTGISTNTSTASPTDTLLPTQTPQPTFTATALTANTAVPTVTLVVVVPTQPVHAVCSCSGDTLNCEPDFDTHAEAQACFEYCRDLVGYDIHELDSDNDGRACQNLP